MGTAAVSLTAGPGGGVLETNNEESEAIKIGEVDVL
jgi:hypothetical protein